MLQPFLSKKFDLIYTQTKPFDKAYQGCNYPPHIGVCSGLSDETSLEFMLPDFTDR